MEGEITFRHNVIGVSGIASFFNIRGRFNNNVKDVYFVRALGMDAAQKSSFEEIEESAKNASDGERFSYYRADKLEVLSGAEQINIYNAIYDMWVESGSLKLHNRDFSGQLGAVTDRALRAVVDIYRKNMPSVTETMEKNLAVKLLFWLDNQFGFVIDGWNLNRIVKITAVNADKLHQYLFFYFLTLLGCDVLLLEIRRDIDVSDELKKLSQTVNTGTFCDIDFPEYNRQLISRRSAVREAVKADLREEENSSGRIKMVIPERNLQRSKKMQSDNRPPQSVGAVQTAHSEKSPHSEKSFEELALLAESIVMIAIHNRAGEVIGTGSGIMIGKGGYILTNNHVAKGGSFFSVRLEGDDKIYKTDEIIKYNSQFDLAIIRIERELKPLKLYDGKKELVRGQKVVAIGSPLGLFNSVSDGIISGFRRINEVDMIQFTAPISHGSSGGAVLDMYGEVIGISTAGFDDGQNINLAVDYGTIKAFAGSFFGG